MYNPMKRGVRPLYAILLLMAMAATLTFKVLFHQNCSFQLGCEALSGENPRRPVFNETLLKHAAVDLNEPRLKREIDYLLEGNFRTHGRQSQRSFLSSGDPRVDLRNSHRLARGPDFSERLLIFRKYLGDLFRKRGFSSDIMFELADEVKSLIGEHNGRYKSCAVVGNSGILLKSDYGAKIDGHEAVIRLNNARTKTFEKNVGSKTNISFVNSNILHLCTRRVDCFCHPYGDNVPIVMYICQPKHFWDYLACNSSHKAPLIVTDPRFDVLCARIAKYYSLKRFIEQTGKDVGEWAPAHDGADFHYSSGMQAVMLALGICERVSIFGFGKSNSATHHYHTIQKVELSLHDYEAEYDFYRDLVERPWAIPFVSDKYEFPPVVMYH
ncbi:Glycosyltransferase family 29 (sialyltransferase) family protein [Striga hermonthica]|uniref:Glycosyltransferase family 29 (Sialyltransferase) family protein n=1 Tax=Striga hermonthica TaxID=68872 RepID=A0A9N7RDE1_STRHE|nr:Glycosyltransferase family 29 (sialyltransferase) family protein [Striga hermonthica]